MIIINTKKFDPANWPEGVWGTYAPGAELKVRKINGDILRGLRKPYLHNDDKYNDVLIDYFLEDQKGFGNEKGQPFPQPLNLDSKKALMNELMINDWVWAFAKSQDVAAEQQVEAEVKNL